MATEDDSFLQTLFSLEPADLLLLLFFYLPLFAQAYLVLGLLAALAFLLFGLERIDGAAHGAFVFRILILPGLVLLWPLVMWRWMRLLRREA